MSLIQQLIREGSLVLWHDYRSGCAHDWTNNDNDGVFNNTLWVDDGMTFPSVSSRIVTTDSPELHLTEGALIALGNFQTNNTYEIYISKRGVGGVNYQFGVYASGLVCYDGVALRTLSATTIGSRYLACNLSHGEVPEGFIDGISAGNFNGSLNVVANTEQVNIGNIHSNNYPCKSVIYAALIINRKLTATEHAQLYGELRTLTWPSKVWGHATRRQYPNQNEPGIVAGWPMEPVGGKVIDVVGGNDGTIHGAIAGKGILGDKLTFDGVDDYLDITGLTSTSGNYTFAVTVQTDIPDSTFVYMLDIVGGRLILVFFTNVSGQIGFYDGTYKGFGSAPNDGAIHRLVYVFDGTASKARLYIDGVQLGSDLAYISKPIGGGITLMSRFDGSSNHLEATMHGDVQIYDEIKDQAWVTTDYQKIAKAVQFKTDWDYKESITNEGGTLHEIIGGSGSPFRAGDTIGRWAVETDTVDGSLCKVLVCKTAGAIYISVASFFDATETEAAFGTWSWWSRLSSGVLRCSFISSGFAGSAPTPGYSWQIDSANTLLVKNGVGAIITHPGDMRGFWAKHTITRDLSGSFSLYQDDVFLGTATDLSAVTSHYLQFDMDAGDKISLGSRKGEYSIAKQLGVV